MVERLIDFTNCAEIQSNGYNGANGAKKCIIYNDTIYLLKIPSAVDKYSNGAVSEYISCHIYESIGIKAQKTLLGVYTVNGIQQMAVACEDFILNEKKRTLDLKDFASFKNMIVNSSSNGYGTELKDILETISTLSIMDSLEVGNHFWNMFIVDAFLGNFDRHNGNWGFLVDRDSHNVEIAPVYDCGSSLYSQLSEDKMKDYLNDEDEINKRIYTFPTSAIKNNNNKINYYDFIVSLENKECNEALKRIYPRIDFSKINEIIEQTPYISNVRKEFYKTMLENRYNKILTVAYDKILSNEKNNNRTIEQEQDEFKIL